VAGQICSTISDRPFSLLRENGLAVTTMVPTRAARGVPSSNGVERRESPQVVLSLSATDE
jgi:hypothetical protein